MSLSVEFFNERVSAIARSESRGYQEIESFLEKNKLNMDHLLRRGLVQSFVGDTATYFNYEVTIEGAAFLAESKEHQFIAVRPGQEGALLDRIDGLV